MVKYKEWTKMDLEVLKTISLITHQYNMAKFKNSAQ